MEREDKKQGIFTLSLDTESIWGVYYGGYADYYQRHFKNWRMNVNRLLDLLTRYQIKATWAFVGHLLLDHCQKINGVVHPDVLDLGYQTHYKNWRLFDPCGNVETHPAWYGKDVFESVKKAFPRQEIATHTFFHTIMDDPACTSEVALSEMRKCFQVAQENGVDLRSIIFPRNHIAHLDIMERLGLKTYRERERNFFQNLPYQLQRPFLFLQHYFALTPPVYNPDQLVKVNGLVGIPASHFLLNYNGFIKKRVIPTRSRLRRAEKGIEKAIKEGSIFHMWFHPFDLGGSDKMLKVLEDILKRAAYHIKAGQLINLTMEEIGDRYEKHLSGK